MSLPTSVRIVEVGPRDGLQNEAKPVSTADKVRFVEELADSGLQDIEVSSFVRPDRVPQLADAGEVFAGIERRAGIRYWALVPNRHGLDAAREAEVTHIAVFTAASEGFNRANINAGVEESLARLKPVIADAKAEGMTVRGYVSTVFGCPYDGKVEPARAAAISRVLLDAGCDEISLGDTIGVAVPRDVEAVLAAHGDLGVPVEKTALHLHDTHGTALANVLAGLQGGVSVFDSSAGGLGGCPYAPGATGNLATEDLAFFLARMGIESGVSLEALARASAHISDSLGLPPPFRARAAWSAGEGET